MKESSFMSTLLIPGPKSPGKDIDVYLRPLIDDLKDLWAKPGVETIDVATGQKFNMRAMVLWTINDFPARSKTAYVGHKRFLKKPHKWRRSLEFNGETENGDPPREFSRDAIMGSNLLDCLRMEGPEIDTVRAKFKSVFPIKVHEENFLVVWEAEDDPDVIHVDNSSDLTLSTSLNDMEIAVLHIDGQSIDADAPPDIIDVVDEDDDIIKEEDPIPYDLADSDDEPHQP
ncbi:hypothetical protein Tco_0551429 [Tanacetum coccineum]